MKEVLLIGSSYSSLQLLRMLKQMNLKVTVVGNLKNDPCHRFSDESIYLDYSNLVNTKKINHSKYDYLVPSFNDCAYLFASKLKERKKFPGVDNFSLAQTIHKKDKFKELLLKSNINTHKYKLFRLNEIESIKNYVSLPAIIKPIDSHSGIGCIKINDAEQLKKFAKGQKKRDNRVFLIEEFIHGTLHSHSAFVKNQNIETDFFVDEFTTVYPFQVNCSHTPTSLSVKKQNKVRRVINILLKNNKFENGLFHTQVIFKKDELFIIESMRRGPGDLYNILIEKSRNFNYTKNYLLPFIGRKFELHKSSKFKFIGRFSLTNKQKKTLNSITLSTKFKKVEFFPLKKTGCEVLSAPLDKIGIFFAEYSSQSEMQKINPKITNLIFSNEYKF